MFPLSVISATLLAKLSFLRQYRQARIIGIYEHQHQNRLIAQLKTRKGIDFYKLRTYLLPRVFVLFGSALFFGMYLNQGRNNE
jgi:hypothetical protein